VAYDVVSQPFAPAQVPGNRLQKPGTRQLHGPKVPQSASARQEVGAPAAALGNVTSPKRALLAAAAH
jgi:hypothetical protein